MSSEKLIRMANQIADFFRSYPEELAVTGIHDHLAAFWTPHMRESLISDAGEATKDLDPLVLKALQTFRKSEASIGKHVAGSGQSDSLGSGAT